MAEAARNAKLLDELEAKGAPTQEVSEKLIARRIVEFYRVFISIASRQMRDNAENARKYNGFAYCILL